MDGVRSPVVRDGVHLPAPPTEKATTRRFSKRVLVGNLFPLAGLAYLGIVTQHPQAAEIVMAYGVTSYAGIGMYYAVGLGDHRTSKGVPGFLDVLTLLVTKGRGGRHGGGE